MGNVYLIGKVNGKIVDLTDEPETDELMIMVHRDNNYNKAEEMLNKGISVEEVQEYFCTNCGGYKEKNTTCKCMEE